MLYFNTLVQVNSELRIVSKCKNSFKVELESLDRIHLSRKVII